MKNSLLVFLFSFYFISLFAQEGNVHETSELYVAPTDSLVIDKLETWKDLKFGVIYHWGLYSLPGIVESWSICSEDVDWIKRPDSITYDEYKKWYWGLNTQFNPQQFDPNQWAQSAYDAGMKYLVFTTKHHDGFCMFDTKETDFSITNGAFKNHPKANVSQYVFDAFREKDFMIGAYFSKPDWHCDYYWWNKFATGDRHVNYSIQAHPERWEKYQKFTFNQLNELTSGYGNIDILWLDGGWVDKADNEDVNMDMIAEMVRKNQPGILLVDRTVHGKYENYLTPERSIPEKQLPYPWESCITLSNDWGWVPNAPYKSSEKVIEFLVEVVAKGGSLLLGIGPNAQGLIDTPVVSILKNIGDWLRTNGNAIYKTRITPNYYNNGVWFTVDKSDKIYNAIYVLKEGEHLPKVIEWEGNIPSPKASIILLQTQKKVKYKVDGSKVTVYLPKNLKEESLSFQYKK